MSTILDALKKSEQERKQNDIPTLADMPAPQERSKWPYWLVAVLIVLLITLLVWFFVLSKPAQVNAKEIVVSNETINNDKINTVALNNGVNTAVASSSANGVNVSVISFAKEQDARFVIINDKLFHEGEFVRAGLKVESILQDSVVLIERGERITHKP